MPIWTDQPPQDTEDQAFALLRIPPTPGYKVLITSPGILGTNTHYWKGRTTPCEPDNCEACAEGAGYRWHGYFAGLRQSDRLHGLYEVPAAAAAALHDFAQKVGTLRGCLAVFRRLGNRPNGRLLVTTQPYDLKAIELPPPPDVAKIMAHIWQTAIKNTPTARTTERGRVLQIAGNGQHHKQAAS
jgi:hypothetical protein